MTLQGRQDLAAVIAEMQARVAGFTFPSGMWKPLADPQLAYDVKRWLALLLAEAPQHQEDQKEHDDQARGRTPADS